MQNHISKTFAGLGALGLDNMRVDIICRADLTVAQHIGDRHHINTMPCAINRDMLIDSSLLGPDGTASLIEEVACKVFNS